MLNAEDISDYEYLNIVVSDELDNQIGLDSSYFTIYMRHDKPAIRLAIKPEIINNSINEDESRKEWMEVGNSLSERLEKAGLGEWFVNSCSAKHIELWESE